jgi:hypothetical protein
LTQAQLKKIINYIKENCKHKVVRTIFNSSNTTTSKYIELTFKYIDRFNTIENIEFTLRFSNHGVPYRNFGIMVIPKFQSIELNITDEIINFNLPSMTVSLSKLYIHIDKTIDYIEKTISFYEKL